MSSYFRDIQRVDVERLKKSLHRAKERAEDNRYPNAYGYLERAVEDFLERIGELPPDSTDQ